MFFKMSLLTMNVQIISPLRFLILAVITLNSLMISAQIVITPNATANVLVSRLVGAGIIYTNPTLTCPSNASGKFNNGLASSVLIDSGVVLTTGRAQTSGTAIGVNGVGANLASVNNNTNGGDANLATAAGTSSANIHDLCKLEFDFIPTGDTIQFNYRFGSEEYPVYNCSQYNDIFAFFLSGPGYATPTNVALVPGTTIPVTINSINNGTVSAAGGGVLANCTSLGTGSPFTSLYVNNSGSTTITYNGLTSLLIAKAAVTPCSTYHMKFAIADVTDHVYDSGVFLQAGSFVSDIAAVSSVTSSNTLPSGNSFAIEGCSPAIITVTRPQAKPYPQTVTYSMSGTATNGLDFTALSGSAIIPANATSTTITVTALQDGIVEGLETLIISINGSVCGGTVTETLTINILPYPVIVKSLNDTICNGQSIALSATAVPSNPNLTFTWSPVSSLSSASGNNVIASPTTTTTYTITSSYPGCPSVDSTIKISVDPTPVLSLTHTNSTCNGLANGSITATGSASMPMTFSLNPSGISGTTLPYTFTNLPPNTYTVTISSSIGCTKTMTASITSPTLLAWTNVQVVNPLCNGSANGSVALSASGGTGIITYTLLPNAVSTTTGSFSALSAGSYTVNAVDANGCTITSAVTINQPAPLPLSVPILTQVSCYGGNTGSVFITASGGTGAIVYDLNAGASSNSTGVFNALSAGSYTIQASDAVGCANTTVVLITEPTVLQFNSVTITNPPCLNINTGVINVTGLGGTPSYLYALNTGAFSTANSFSGLAASVYTIHIKDSKGCLKDSVVTLVPSNSMSFANVSTQNVYCTYDYSGFINLQTIGGVSPYVYQLNGSSTGTNSNFLNLQAGIYSIYVADILGCMKDTVITITEPTNALNFNSMTLTNITCFGEPTGQINASALGGTSPYQFAKNGGAFQASGLFASLSAGTFTMSVTDFYGCQKDSVVQLVQPSSPLVLNLNRKKEITCIGLTDGILQMGATGGVKPYAYSINGGPVGIDSNFLQLSAGNYLIEVTDSNGCKSSASFVIAVPTKRPYVHIDRLVLNICNGDNMGMVDWSGINGFAPYNYIVNGNFIDTVSILNNLVSGNYIIQLTDSVGCTCDTTITIVNSTTLTASIATVGASCSGDGKDGKATASVSGGLQPYQYKWLGYSDTSSMLVNASYGNQVLIVQDSEGCTDTVHYEIEYVPCCDIYMPNAFSPNNDGHNDLFRIIDFGVITLKSFEIFDRWGHKVFSTNSIDGAWDGKFQDSDYEIGTYYYLIRYACLLSTELIIKKGDFTLLR